MIGISLSNGSCPYEFTVSMDFWLKTTSHVGVAAPLIVVTIQNDKLLPSPIFMLCRVTRSQRTRHTLNMYNKYMTKWRCWFQDNNREQTLVKASIRFYTFSFNKWQLNIPSSFGLFLGTVLCPAMIWGGIINLILRSIIFPVLRNNQNTVTYSISHSYLTGVPAAELQWHLPNTKVS